MRRLTSGSRDNREREASSIERKVTDHANFGADVRDSTIEVLEKMREHVTDEAGACCLPLLDRLVGHHDDGIVSHHFAEIVGITGVLGCLQPFANFLESANICLDLAGHSQKVRPSDRVDKRR